MSLDQAYVKLYQEIESKKGELLDDYSFYLENNKGHTDEQKRIIFENKHKKEREFMKLNSIREKFEECKRYSSKMDLPPVSESTENNRNIKRSKRGKKPLIHYRIDGVEYETQDKIELLRTLIEILGGEKFLEIVDDDTFKYKSYFQNRNKEKLKRPNLKKINTEVHFSSEVIFKVIQEILPYTNIQIMIVSMENKNLIHYSRS